MTIKHLLTGALALGIGSTAFAQTTEITITGATAFRQATMRGIYEAYLSEGALGTSFNVAHNFTGNNLSQLIASNRAVFSGKFPGITGTTIIRTSFNGSTEGLNGIAGNNNPVFLQVSALGTPGANILGGVSGPTETLRPKFSFSDVFQSTSPITTDLNGDPITLQPAGASAVGVVTFTMVANEGAPAAFTNATQQQCSALWSSGFAPLSLFTGNPADTTFVFATGRNDGSGTRSAYLTEWQFGAANLVNQYVATAAGVTVSGQITAITLVPVGGTGAGALATSGGASNASTLWGNDVLGNGGYSSSSALRDHMARTTASVTVYDGADAGSPLLEGEAILLLTWLSTADARNAVSAGAKLINYNGYGVVPRATTDPLDFNDTGFSEEDFNKIISGAYSAWSYQHLYHWGTLSANETIWRNQMTAAGGWLEDGLQLTANGVRSSDMLAERADDGFPIFAQ